MRLRLLSRASALAVLQAELVARALHLRWPGLDVVRMTRTSEGDRDRGLDLWNAAEKGVFTADLSQQLVADDADLVVHSWKDLPIESHAGTTVAATLERADARDVLLVRRDVVRDRPAALNVLSSSPRRAWQLTTSLAPLLPWTTSELRILPVRGNIPTRLNKLLTGDADALVVAKAALDRLLSGHAAPVTTAAVPTALDACRWMVLPRTHLFWTSGSLFLKVLGAHPELRDAWHASGPGRTSRVIRDTLGGADRVSVWLDYDQWHHHVTQQLH